MAGPPPPKGRRAPRPVASRARAVTATAQQRAFAAARTCGEQLCCVNTPEAAHADEPPAREGESRATAARGKKPRTRRCVILTIAGKTRDTLRPRLVFGQPPTDGPPVRRGEMAPVTREQHDLERRELPDIAEVAREEPGCGCEYDAVRRRRPPPTPGDSRAGRQQPRGTVSLGGVPTKRGDSRRRRPHQHERQAQQLARYPVAKPRTTPPRRAIGRDPPASATPTPLPRSPGIPATGYCPVAGGHALPRP